MTMVAAAAQQYPFAGRLALFLAPSLVLVVAATVSLLRDLAGRQQAIVSALVATLIVVPVADALRRRHPVYDMEPLRPVLAHLAGLL